LTFITTIIKGAGSRFIVRIDDTGHRAFVPVCVRSVCGEGCPPAGIDQATANHLVLRVAVPFVLRYAAGKTRFDPFLKPATLPAGMTMVTNTVP
jgi:hypothetical protein